MELMSYQGSYAQYLHDMHSQNQLGLSGEPKTLGADKLGGFRITASRARSSMLSMNGILWKEDGCVNQSDELASLEIEANSQDPVSHYESGLSLDHQVPEVGEGDCLYPSRSVYPG